MGRGIFILYVASHDECSNKVLDRVGVLRIAGTSWCEQKRLTSPKKTVLNSRFRLTIARLQLHASRRKMRLAQICTVGSNGQIKNGACLPSKKLRLGDGKEVKLPKIAGSAQCSRGMGRSDLQNK